MKWAWWCVLTGAMWVFATFHIWPPRIVCWWVLIAWVMLSLSLAKGAIVNAVSERVTERLKGASPATPELLALIDETNDLLRERQVERQNRREEFEEDEEQARTMTLAEMEREARMYRYFAPVDPPTERATLRRAEQWEERARHKRLMGVAN